MDDWDELYPAEEGDADVGALLFEQLGAGDIRTRIQYRASEIASLIDCEVGDATFERVLIALTVTCNIMSRRARSSATREAPRVAKQPIGAQSGAVARSDRH